ncbi:GGDEF domain-containing protein [Acinetobacter sp.]|uniref:GGDEF domain-containing protein n=1 Tax=Acinetobacter sp. TaxID=472 RepID=UPI000C096458|nr:GGDEF domain-containing protein [Acinetobacter sp.]MAK29179.1 GGDEF domain-containing protein [Acinetobacter sp.]
MNSKRNNELGYPERGKTASIETSIRYRLFLFLFILILSFLIISLPQVFSSYQQLQQSHRGFIEIKLLETLTDTANKISRERAFANQLMASPPELMTQKRRQLNEYRLQVDASLQQTIRLLNDNEQQQVAQVVSVDIQSRLEVARHVVDQYVNQPLAHKSYQQYDHAIRGMFSAWDSCREALKKLLISSSQEDDGLSRNMTLILLVSDLRDQSGRVVSNIIAPVSFSIQIPDDNRARSLQTQHQAIYLWKLIDTLQPDHTRTPEYLHLYQQVKTQFLDEGIELVSTLLRESDQHRAYSLSAISLTEQIVSKFNSIVALQNYLVQTSLAQAEQQEYAAWQKFILTVLISIFSLLVAGLTLRYIQRYILLPLMEARESILALSLPQSYGQENRKKKRFKGEFAELFAAIAKLKRLLSQKDALEFQLRNIAHTDTLTGVANRQALEAYFIALEQEPWKWSDLCLMIIDIDYFKQINDQYGHMVGDQVIQRIADQLQQHVDVSDLIVRYGGDEFLILIEDIAAEDALQLAEKISKSIYTLCIAPDISTSVSIGLAVGARNWLPLFQNADQALLRAKAKGKNRVEG